MITENGTERNAAYDLEKVLAVLRDFAVNHSDELEASPVANIPPMIYELASKMVIPMGKPKYSLVFDAGKRRYYCTDKCKKGKS